MLFVVSCSSSSSSLSPVCRGVPVLPAALPADCPGAGGRERGVPELHCEAPPAGPTETGRGRPHRGTRACLRPGPPRVPAVLQAVGLRKALSLKPDTQPSPGVETFCSGVLGQRRAGVAPQHARQLPLCGIPAKPAQHHQSGAQQLQGPGEYEVDDHY